MGNIWLAFPRKSINGQGFCQAKFIPPFCRCLAFLPFLFSIQNEEGSGSLMTKREPDKQLKLRAAPTTGLGKTIAYLQDHPTNTTSLAAHILQTRILPFALDKNDPQFQGIALQCAEECESWARAIRQYAGLPQAQMMPQPAPSINHRHEEKVEKEEIEETSPPLTEMEEEQQQADEELKNMGLSFGHLFALLKVT